MQRRSAPIVLSLLSAVAALALAGCVGETSPEPSGTKTGGTVTAAIASDLSSLNVNTPDAAAVATNGIVAELTTAGFVHVDQHANPVADTSFGSVEKTSDSPLTVKYTLKAGLKWSDGVAITADDLLLTWAIDSGYYDDANYASGSTTPISGTQYFSPASSIAGLHATALPQLGADGRSMTLVYSTPDPDWNYFSPVSLPAHVVAKKAGLASAAELTKLLQSIPKGDPASPRDRNDSLRKVADFVDTGYKVTAFPSDSSLLVASGPLVLSSWTPGKEFTLTRNPDYTGALAPRFDRLVVKIMPDSDAQVTALRDGRIQLAVPQLGDDTASALRALDGVSVLAGGTAYADRVLLNFGSSAFASASARKAMLLTVPRARIAAELAKPIDGESAPLDSLVWLRSQTAYAASVKANGISAYAKPDTAKAKELLAGATPTYRVVFNPKNQYSATEFKLMAESAKEAGVTLQQVGQSDWQGVLTRGEFDVAIVSWLSPVGGTSLFTSALASTGPSNFTHYSGADAPIAELVKRTDAAGIASIGEQIDKQLVSDAYGLPLLQQPGAIAVSSKLSGVTFTPDSATPFGDVWNWRLS